MRLLTQDPDGILRLQNYISTNDTPPYAVLSHVWGSEKLSYEHVETGAYRNMPTYEKLNFLVRRAKADGLDFYWMHSCCVDSRSSAELTESTNTSYDLLKRSVKAYVFLNDVRYENWQEDFERSEWHTRSWTLQELLAPPQVEFFSRNGKNLGDKKRLLPMLLRITGIPASAITGDRDLSDFSVAERMRWASGRIATAVEDEAYSLMGILDVKMPVLYGEGARAMARLKRLLPQTTQGQSSYGIRMLVSHSNPYRMDTVRDNGDLQYAIVSHTWEPDEVLFDDMRTATYEYKRGFHKIRESCRLAASAGFSHVWLDTCCIDKSSSSELQEAICSMYAWYKNASVCYVYLGDYNLDQPTHLSKCRWFRRGWTLQELIAPRYLIFYDRNWREVGTKMSLCTQIAEITKIPKSVLLGEDPHLRSVAERMSWAASRSTERVEDAAYSLLGLFDVFMPMLYGEGHRAFIRLQEEIIRKTEDLSIFAWLAEDGQNRNRGIFAHTPAEFSDPDSNRLSGLALTNADAHAPATMTSRGLVLTLLLREVDSRKGEYYAAICYGGQESRSSSAEDGRLFCIQLREIESDPRVFVRSAANLIFAMPWSRQTFKRQTICIRHVISGQFSDTPSIRSVNKILVTYAFGRGDKLQDHPLDIRLAPLTRRSSINEIIYELPNADAAALAIVRPVNADDFFVFLGLYEKQPWCRIVTRTDQDWQQGDFTSTRLPSILHLTPIKIHSDRAKAVLHDGYVLNVAIRPTRCVDERDLFSFRLEIQLIEPSPT